MKGLNVLASGMILFGLVVCAPRANAEKLPNRDFQPQTEKLQVQFTFTQSTTDNNSSKSYLEQGFELFAKEDYRGAIQAFNQAIQREPNQTYGYLCRSLAYFNLKQYQEAKVDLDKTINLNPDIGFAYFVRGISNYFLSNKQLAMTDLQTAANVFQKAGETEMAQKSLDTLEWIRNA